MLYAAVQQVPEVHRLVPCRRQLPAGVGQDLADHVVHAFYVLDHALGLLGRGRLGAQPKPGQGRPQVVRNGCEHPGGVFRLHQQAGTRPVHGLGQHAHLARALLR